MSLSKSTSPAGSWRQSVKANATASNSVSLNILCMINPLGQVAFLGNVAGGSATLGIFVGDGSTVVSKALQGQLAPASTGTDGTFSTFTDFALNRQGQVVFTANVGGSPNNSGIFATF